MAIFKDKNNKEHEVSDELKQAIDETIGAQRAAEREEAKKKHDKDIEDLNAAHENEKKELSEKNATTEAELKELREKSETDDERRTRESLE